MIQGARIAVVNISVAVRSSHYDGRNFQHCRRGRHRLAGLKLKAYTNRQVLQVLALGVRQRSPATAYFFDPFGVVGHRRRAPCRNRRLRTSRHALRLQILVVSSDRPPARPAPAGTKARLGSNDPNRTNRRDTQLGRVRSKQNLARMGVLALLVAFLSASQDVVIDAWRVEILATELQGPGAGMIQTGYRIAMLVSGAGALFIAARVGWFAAYATMAALLTVGILVFLFGPEPKPAPESVRHSRPYGGDGLRQWLATAVTGPFAEFMRRPLWAVILVFILGYKLGEALAGVMATPLYVSLGFSLDEIAAVSKLVGFFATVAGALIGGVVTARFGILRSLMLCGVLQSAGNLFYVLQAVGWAPNRLSRALRYRRESHGRNGRLGSGRLSLQLVLSRLHGHSVRAAVFARGGRAHAGGVFRRPACRQAWLGPFLSSDHCGHRAGPAAARLDRAAQHN